MDRPAVSAAVDYDDVQGVVRFGYKHLTEASYLLLRIRDRAAARAWLRAAPVTSAVAVSPPPPCALQVAFTADGLLAAGVAPGVVAGFSDEFLSGMSADPSRSRRLGDVGENAPARWRWGAAGDVPHVLVMAFARRGELSAFMSRVTGAGWDEAFELMHALDTSDLHGVEHFGFLDGISQPVPDWDGTRAVAGDQFAYSNVVALGEMLLGYRNEYGKYTDRPLLDDDAAARALLAAPDAPAKRDLGRNGTYLVLRDLRQDVRAFWTFAARSAGSAAAAPELAAAFVGRRMNGEPLVPIRAEPIPGVGPDPVEIAQNQFTYDVDAAGTRCPFGAHIRRANPRTADYPAKPSGALAHLAALLGFAPTPLRGDLISSVRFHRILRRGREYGPALPADAALASPSGDETERGLRFVCINANISRQFEFLQNAWLMRTTFDGMTDESDPLLGNRQPVPGRPSSDVFTIPREDGVRRRVPALPAFVTVQGGAYFFLPSLRALRYVAQTGE